MQKRISAVCFAVVVVALLGLAVGLLPAEAQDWESYDTFNFLDPTKWSGDGGNNMWAVYKFIREVPKKKKELLLAVEVYGPNADNEDVWAANGLRTDPYEVTSSIKAMKVDVQVKEHEPACCGGECAGAVAEILGSIFHVSPTLNVCDAQLDPCNPSPENCIPPDAEVHVGIALQTQNPNAPDFSEDRLDVRARVYWCETQGSCACGQEIEWDIIERGIKVGSDNTISWDWNADGDEVIFQINDADPVAFSYHDFLNDVGGSDDTLAFGAFKALGVSAGGRTCNGGRQRGYIEAACDDVEVKTDLSSFSP